MPFVVILGYDPHAELLAEDVQDGEGVSAFAGGDVARGVGFASHFVTEESNMVV